jgi:Ni,Fe-hydrogenase III small subunit
MSREMDVFEMTVICEALAKAGIEVNDRASAEAALDLVARISSYVTGKPVTPKEAMRKLKALLSVAGKKP